MGQGHRRCVARAGTALVTSLLAVTGMSTPATAAVTGTTTRASVASDGTQGNGASTAPDISADGRFVVFESSAPDLVPDDTNGGADLFVRDRQTGATSRVSVATGGTQATSPGSAGHEAQISADGRHVVFQSNSPDLVADDTNGFADVFVHDRQTGVTSRVSVATGGTQGGSASSNPAISADGRYVAFSSGASNFATDANPLTDVFVHDRQTGTTTLVSVSSDGRPALGVNGRPAISGDGRHVAFQSSAANLVTDTNNAEDIFVRDRQTGVTSRVSVASGGAESNGASQDPSMSADGAIVAFHSVASNLVVGDTNARRDVFVHDRASGNTKRVSVASDGTQGSPSAGNATPPDVSADGRYVTFASYADLSTGDTNGGLDIYLHDRQKARTTRMNVATDGTPRDGNTSGQESSAVSGDGRYVTFDATATNLVDGDTNGVSDVFVRDRQSVPTVPALSVGNAKVHEGDAGTRAAVFTATLSRPSASTVTVGYATGEGSVNPATPEVDYTSASGTLTFAPGVTSQVVKVPVAGDTLDEGNFEEFSVRLSGASGAFLADGTGVATIYDDDPDERIGRRLAIGDVAVHEGDAGTRAAVFNVSLSGPHTTTASVGYTTVKGTATKPDDFIATSGTLSFAPGTTSQQVKVQIGADTVPEGNETFTVTLSGATGAVFISDATGLGTIVDND